MRCPACHSDATGVFNSRPNELANAVYRRRQCETCAHRFTTYEVVAPEEVALITPNGAVLRREADVLTEAILSAISEVIGPSVKRAFGQFSSPVTK